MSPTSTLGLPPVIACASGVWIWFMSHCNPERLSPPVTGVAVVGSAPPEPAASAAGNLYANRSVDDAFWILASFSRLSRNDGLLDDAMTTPICGYVATMLPPAFWIVVDESAGTACWL